MAHQVENMFYVKQEPWHGLGVKLEEPPTSEEAIKLAGLDWKVDLSKIIVCDQEQDNWLAITRSTDKRVYGIVKPGWEPLQNNEAFSFFDPIVKEGFATYECAGSLKNGEIVWILARLTGENLVVGKGDEIEKYLLLSNGHTGKVGVNVQFTATRVVCANTLAMAHGETEMARRRFIHSSKTKASLEQLRETINFANQSFDKTVEVYKDLAQVGLSNDKAHKFFEKVFYPDGVGDTDKKRIVENVFTLYKTHPTNQVGGMSDTAWSAFNAVTFYVDHVRGRNAGNRLYNSWFGTGKTITDRAFVEAQRLAA